MILGLLVVSNFLEIQSVRRVRPSSVVIWSDYHLNSLRERLPRGMSLWEALGRTMECRQLCKDISWLDCGKLRYHAFSDELSLRVDSAMTLGLVLALGVVIGFILSWIPTRIGCLFELLHKKCTTSTNSSDINIVRASDRYCTGIQLTYISTLPFSYVSLNEW